MFLRISINPLIDITNRKTMLWDEIYCFKVGVEIN